ncbi:MAG TPA: lycopene cyclase family protein [Polyangiaceae bacterium]
MGCTKQNSGADVAVMGAGPAGLALAAHCAQRGLDTVLVAPHPEAPWRQSYGAFAVAIDGVQIPKFEVASATISRYRPLVAVADEPPQSLDATYVRFDTHRLQFGLLDAVKALGVRLIDDTIDDLAPSAAATCLSGPKSRLLAKRVFDATGSDSRFSRRTRKQPLGYQSAYGRWLVVDSLPCAADEMWLMDYRDIGVAAPPSFLYAVPESEHLLFAQETVLAARTPVPMRELAQRLEARVQRLGLRIRECRGEEHCVIPLGVGLPLDQGMPIPFGAAAGFVNPVSGYQLGHALRVAERVATAVTRAADAPALHAVVWRASERHAFLLYHAALDQMLRIEAREFGAFISSFFALETPVWLRFMTGEQSPADVIATLWKLFARAPAALRLDLVRAAAHSGAAALASLTTPNVSFSNYPTYREPTRHSP